MDGRAKGRTDARTNERTGERTDGRTYGRMDGRTNGRIYIHINTYRHDCMTDRLGERSDGEEHRSGSPERRRSDDEVDEDSGRKAGTHRGSSLQSLSTAQQRPVRPHRPSCQETGRWNLSLQPLWLQHPLQVHDTQRHRSVYFYIYIYIYIYIPMAPILELSRLCVQALISLPQVTASSTWMHPNKPAI